MSQPAKAKSGFSLEKFKVKSEWLIYFTPFILLHILYKVNFYNNLMIDDIHILVY